MMIATRVGLVSMALVQCVNAMEGAPGEWRQRQLRRAPTAQRQLRRAPSNSPRQPFPEMKRKPEVRGSYNRRSGSVPQPSLGMGPGSIIPPPRLGMNREPKQMHPGSLRGRESPGAGTARTILRPDDVVNNLSFDEARDELYNEVNYLHLRYGLSKPKRNPHKLMTITRWCNGLKWFCKWETGRWTCNVTDTELDNWFLNGYEVTRQCKKMHYVSVTRKLLV